jgi:hypothetical protein
MLKLLLPHCCQPGCCLLPLLCHVELLLLLTCGGLPLQEGLNLVTYTVAPE